MASSRVDGCVKLSIGLCEDFNGMPDWYVVAVLCDPLTQLQDATRIARDDELRSYGGNMGHLTVEQGLRRIAVDDVIDPGTATTPVTFGDVMEVQVGNLAQERAGLCVDLLAMQEMTGIVIRDPHR